MKFSNKFGLPDAIVRAVTNDKYSKGDVDYSVSDLIGPARKLALERKHRDEIVEDVSDRVWALFGQSVHVVAERANIEDVVERRLAWKLIGKTFSGAMDHYNPKTGVLTDYKTASVFKFSFNDFEDWELQQNCYAQLLRFHNEKIEKLQIVAFVKDWRTREAKEAGMRGKPYPNKVELVNLPLWVPERAISYLEERIKVHEMAKNALPPCTAEERWARASGWAIKKVGGKVAIIGGVYAIQDFAEERLKQLGAGYYIEYRPGVSNRCESYCNAAPFCDQFKKEKK